MPDQGQHCPFLNRADARCASHLCLDDLQYAFRYCFDRYKTCSTYLELLVERRVRQSTERAVNDVGASSQIESSPQSPSRVVQLTFGAERNRNVGSPAIAPAVSNAPRV
jgi:hypothetical protein